MRLWRRLLCRLGRHSWEIHTIVAGGIMTVIPRCECGRVDIDHIRQGPWARRHRREWRRRSARAIRKRAWLLRQGAPLAHDVFDLTGDARIAYTHAENRGFRRLRERRR